MVQTLRIPEGWEERHSNGKHHVYEKQSRLTGGRVLHVIKHDVEDTWHVQEQQNSVVHGEGDIEHVAKYDSETEALDRAADYMANN